MAHPHTVPFLPAIPADCGVDLLKELEDELEDERKTIEKLGKGRISTSYVAPDAVFTDSPDSQGYVKTGSKTIMCCKKACIGILAFVGCSTFVVGTILASKWSPYVVAVLPAGIISYLLVKLLRRYYKKKQNADALSVRYQRLLGRF